MRRFSLPALILLPAVLCAPLAAQSSPARAIELILDASGSMNARLRGQPKIDGARAAVEKFTAGLPASDLLAFRAYGHQSPRQKHDCADIQLLAPFAPAGGSRARVVAAAKGLKAQGYTPITDSLRLAAKDFPATAPKRRIVVLVSDGKETCEGDPCAAARELAAAGIVVHTIGFDVDAAARMQLECVAKATGGAYFEAADAERLAALITQAADTTAKAPPQPPKGVGKLGIEGPSLLGHAVLEAATGKEVAQITHVRSIVSVPAGLYNVRVGAALWKSIEVKTGETTMLRPGRLHIEGASLRGHPVLDSETGVEHARPSVTNAYATLMPGTYDVMFGELAWEGVRIESGKITELRPGILHVKGATIQGHAIRTADGRAAGSVSATGSSIPLPPGAYTVEFGGVRQPFTIAEGQRVEIERPAQSPKRR